MKRKTLFGMLLLIAICLLPLIPWFVLGPASSLEPGYENITHRLGQVTGLVGMSLFAMTFVLSTRVRSLEKLLGGLDKVYGVHAVIGALAFILLLFHPILLVMKFIPQRMDLAALYLLPGHGLSVDLGIIALAGMMALLAMTFYVSLKYNYWKISHKFFGAIFIIAVFHIFLVRGTASRDIIFPGYYAYAAIVSIIGIGAFFYSILLRRGTVASYKVTSAERHKDYFDIRLQPEAKPIRYRAGQFAFFRFHNKKLGLEYHPFSIAAGSNSRELRIIIKSLGDYTQKLGFLEVGDMVSVEGPYGAFTCDGRKCEMIWVGAGIGITPFIGMAKDMALGKDRNRATLYYCASTEQDLIALDELKDIERKNPSFRLIAWPTKIKGRLSLKDIKDLDRKKQVYVCGPAEFKRAIISQMRMRGIPEQNIFEEDFGLR